MQRRLLHQIMGLVGYGQIKGCAIERRWPLAHSIFRGALPDVPTDFQLLLRPNALLPDSTFSLKMSCSNEPTVAAPGEDEPAKLMPRAS